MARLANLQEVSEMYYLDPDNTDREVSGNLTKLNLQYLETQLMPIIKDLANKSSEEILEALNVFIEGGYDPKKIEQIARSHDEKRLFHLMAYDWAKNSAQTTFIINPWMLEHGKVVTVFRYRLQAVRDLLPVRVVTKEGDQYTHNLSEDIMAGILFGLGNSDSFSFYLNEAIEAGLEPVPLKSKDFDKYKRYSYTYRYSTEYVGKVFGNLVGFKNGEFVRGIITAAKWTNKDPHLILTELRKLTQSTGDGVRVEF